MLDTYIEAVERRRKWLTVYSDADATDLSDRLAARNVTVVHRKLPPHGPSPFVTIYDGETFVGAIGLETLEQLLEPPVIRPTDRTGLSEGYRALLEVLEETLFTALDRRQLLATSREIEDRAFRMGRGTLRVGFQRLSAFEHQVPLYRRLGEETNLEVHVYGRPDWEPPSLENVRYHRDEAGALAPFWCLAFDGGEDPMQACALVARERESGFLGFWTYDPGLVGEILEALEAVE
ncbi:DICT sensory domain-containing protein [Natronosalvus caseinilyticus]|uniref:DICT sensory domain-containing protein n=1 Tax=Natronosalvus caseinilyticus TaxID=2953747 RepID=UPI0028A8DD22|nr:DICT sensory domain-containing protein [Natronosalvus caseinilyticus]